MTDFQVDLILSGIVIIGVILMFVMTIKANRELYPKNGATIIINPPSEDAETPSELLATLETLSVEPEIYPLRKGWCGDETGHMPHTALQTVAGRTEYITCKGYL